MGISIGTIIGIVGGIGLLVYNIVAKAPSVGIFIDVGSLMMVVGGTLAASFIAFKETYVLQALKGILQIFKSVGIDKKSLVGDVEKIIEWGKIVEKGGIRELEKQFDEKELDNPIMKFSMDMVFAGEKSDLIYKETKNLIESEAARRSVPVDILNTMASYAPAFGMAGTLIGLVILLSNLADKDSIGVGMAIAIITTLYGVIFANLILKPTAAKLEQYNGIQRFRDLLILEGVSMLPNKPDPYYIQNHLNSYLNPKFHFDSADS